jgi:tripartite-type tricarboxylate transporter receptor subunit TctC
MLNATVRSPLCILIALAATFTAACAGEPASSSAPQWPTRAVRLIMPLAAGGGPDLVARSIGEALSKRWQQPVIVDNRPGGDAVVAARAVIDAADDHTLLFGPNSVVTANLISRSASYSETDFVPIAAVVEVPIAVITGASNDVASLDILLAQARRAPGAITHTTVFGAPQMMWTQLLKDQAIDMPMVGYRNPNVAIPDLIENRVQVAVLPLGTTLPAVRAGQVRVLTLLTTRRSALVPDVPTIGEAGYPQYAVPGALGFFAVPGPASDRRDWIAGEIQAVLGEPALASQLLTAGFEVRYAGPGDYASSLDRERAQLRSAAGASR